MAVQESNRLKSFIRIYSPHGIDHITTMVGIVNQFTEQGCRIRVPNSPQRVNNEGCEFSWNLSIGTALVDSCKPLSILESKLQQIAELWQEHFEKAVYNRSMV